MYDDLIAEATIEKVINDENLEYNPVFFYSKESIKEEFLDEIGIKYQEKNSDKYIVRTSAKLFLDEFIKAVQSDSVDIFRNKYYSCDMLIISEIEFAAGKEKTQELLYVIMDRMLEAKKRIIIASSCAPGEPACIADRNLAIYTGGLVLNI